jgi:hypothetical protein
MSSFEEKIFNQVKRNYNVEGAFLKLIGTLDLRNYSFKEIDQMVSLNLQGRDFSNLPFCKTVPSKGISLYQITNDTYVTFYDSSELFQDPEIVKLYKV